MGLNKRLIDQAGGGSFDPEDNFDEITYGGNATARSFTTGFQPDLVWVKSKKLSYNHTITDSVRGVGVDLASNLTDTEQSSTNRITALNTDGFSVGTDARVNSTTTGNSYWAWAWKGGGTAVSNTDGSITSSVSANQDAGFSIISYSGNQTASTVGHGLSQAPEMIIAKSRTVAQNWVVYHKDAGSNYWLQLNGTVAKIDEPIWNDTTPTDSVFSMNGNVVINKSGSTNIAYAFHSVDSYQKIGSYVGNASTVSVTTGFQPRMIFLKNTNNSWTGWMTHSPSIPGRYTRLDDVDSGNTSGIVTVSFNSTGFSINSSNDTWNQNGATFIYYAVA